MNKQETYRYLTEQGVEFEITEHIAVFNMAEVAQIELPYPEVNGKNLFVRDKKHNYYVITTRGDRRVDLKAFRKQNGIQGLSFATPEELYDILGLIPGAVTPLGLLNDSARHVTLYFDESFLDGMIGVHPNDNTATIWLQARDLIRVIEAHGNTVKIVPI